MEEIFGFTLEDYPVDHQSGAIVDIEVAYRLVSNLRIDPSSYPDIRPISKDIQEFIINYPNETDFWEILNRKLAQFILDKNPHFSALKIKIDVKPIPPKKPIYYGHIIEEENYGRFSIVTIKRPNSCPLH